MPELSFKIESGPAGGRNKANSGFIYLDSEQAIKVFDFYSIDIPTGVELEDSRLLGLYWYSDNEPTANVSALREVILRHEREFESPDVRPSEGKFDPMYKGVLLFSRESDYKEYEIEYFLDETKFSSLLKPELTAVRVNTPNGDFVVDYKSQEGEERREITVLSHSNIADLVTDLTMQTATILTPHQDLKRQLEVIYNKIMGTNYPVPLRKAS